MVQIPQTKEAWVELLRNNHAAFEEALRVYNGDRRSSSLSYASPPLDLRGIDLREVDFSYKPGLRQQSAYFRNVDFTGADFRGAKLRKASFADCILDGADFSYANLRQSYIHAPVRAAAAKIDGALFSSKETLQKFKNGGAVYNEHTPPVLHSSVIYNPEGWDIARDAFLKDGPALAASNISVASPVAEADIAHISPGTNKFYEAHEKTAERLSALLGMPVEFDPFSNESYSPAFKIEPTPDFDNKIIKKTLVALVEGSKIFANDLWKQKTAVGLAPDGVYLGRTAGNLLAEKMANPEGRTQLTQIVASAKSAQASKA